MANTGISTYLANSLLNQVFRGIAWTPPTVVYFQAHTGQPGAAMTSNIATNTTRLATTWAAAASGSIGMSNQPEHVIGSATQENITHGSFWDSLTGGNPLYSADATVVKGGVSGDIIRVSSNTLSLTPLASD